MADDPYYAESFENLAPWGGQYGKIAGKNGWSSSSPGSDNSGIVCQEATLSPALRPLPLATHTNILNLDTGGALLKSDFGDGLEVFDQRAYLDLATKLLPVTGRPTICTVGDSQLIYACYVASNSKLMLYHGVAAANGALLSNTVTETGIFVDTQNWHRLTIEVDVSTAQNANRVAMYRLLYDGKLASSAKAYGDGWRAALEQNGQLPAPSANGIWFRAATDDFSDHNLGWLGFSGKGGVDDLVVSATAPFNNPPIYTNQPPSITTAAKATPSPVTGTTTALSVVGADDGGEAALTYSWATIGSPPASVNFSVNGSNAAKNTTATFSKAGNYSFRVTIKDGGNLTATSDVNVTVGQSLTSISLSPAMANINSGATQQFTASASDQFGAALASQPTFTWSVSGGGTINNSGLFTAGVSSGGPFTVTASASGKSGTASVTINNQPPSVATAAKATPSPVTGTTSVLSVLGADDGGEATLTYTWATTGTPPALVSFSVNGNNGAKSTTATFAKSGSYSFRVTIKDSGGLTTTSDVNVTVQQTLSAISVAPATATLALRATQQFAASASDQFGTLLATQPTFTWSVSGGGTINNSGLFTGGTTPGGPHTITASANGKSGTAQVTLLNQAPTIATAAQATPSPATGTTSALSVLGADDGGEAALSYTWATSGTPPASVSFSVNGNNAAKNTTATFSKAGAYSFRVVIKDAQGSQVTSELNVTVQQTATSVALTPAFAVVAKGGQQQFAAETRDQFGTPLAPQPAFNWSLSGGGSISAGLFTAGTNAGGPHTVSAKAGNITGTAQVMVAFAISATAGNGGTISPVGEVGVTNKGTVAFSITADTWYKIADVVVDGLSKGAIASHTFANVTSDHTITASFEALCAARGTPLWWLAQYGWTTNFDAVEAADQDGDGIPTWQEYLDASDPTDPLARRDWNSVPYAESFENLAGWGGTYGKIAGRMGWSSSAADDNSLIVAAPAPVAEALRPLPQSSHTNLLAFNSGGGGIKTGFGSGFDMSGIKTYIDTVMRFEAADVMPPECTSTDSGRKLAVFVNPAGKLMVYHGMAANDGTLLSNRVSETAALLGENEWHRLTIELDATFALGAGKLSMFRIFVDGNVVASDAAYGDGWRTAFENSGQLPAPAADGVWFRLATQNASHHLLTSLEFVGQGGVDDLVVATNAPFVPAGPGQFYITASAAEGGSITPSGMIAVTQGGNQSFAIRPLPGHQILDVMVNQTSMGGITNYTFHNVQSDGQISATFTTFALEPLQIDPANGAIKVRFTGLANRLYEVQYKDDLESTLPWQTLTTLTGNGASVIFTDPAPPAQRFYRIRALP